uniref:Uncharacterized protein n=1 Tax=Rhizophora mucronata TaxID=61149 RepID=A0A2P2NM08_RHIMU
MSKQKNPEAETAFKVIQRPRSGTKQSYSRKRIKGHI